LRILVAKIAVSFVAIVGGLTIGREGPTVQIGAALMFNMRRFYPRSNSLIERQLVLAGAAAGLSAAFNTPLAGIVFAIEELTRSFEARASGVLITGIIIAGVIALGLSGNYTYFGTIQAGALFPRFFLVAIIVTANGFPCRCDTFMRRGRSCSRRSAASSSPSSACWRAARPSAAVTPRRAACSKGASNCRCSIRS
jgi:H+/Cl- antiporter ClcA